MKTINLKEYYPYYQEDTYVEVSDEVAEQLEENKHSDEAYRIQTLRHKAYYSLDVGDQIDREAITNNKLSMDDVYEHQAILRLLRRELDELSPERGILTEKQLRRILKFYFDEVSYTKIAEQEGCDRTSVKESIERGLMRLKKYIEK